MARQDRQDSLVVEVTTGETAAGRQRDRSRHEYRSAKVVGAAAAVASCRQHQRCRPGVAILVVVGVVLVNFAGGLLTSGPAARLSRSPVFAAS